MDSKQIYLRFLNMIHALDGGANAPTMDFDAKRLLEVIAVRHSEQKPLTVTDAMALNSMPHPPPSIARLINCVNSAWSTPCLKATTAAPSIWFPHKQRMTTLTKLEKSCSKPSRPHKPEPCAHPKTASLVDAVLLSTYAVLTSFLDFVGRDTTAVFSVVLNLGHA